MTLGKLVPPYPREDCANVECQRPLAEVDGVYLFQDLDALKNGLVVLCDDCARYVELNNAERFKAVLL